MAFTYLVTGAAGFIGSRFVEECAQRGVQVISVDRKSHFHDRTEHDGINFGQILDRDELFEALESYGGQSPLLPTLVPALLPALLKDKKIDGIVHLGAITDTREKDQSKLNRQNVEYSKRIWNWATRARIPLVYASSAATYGEGSYFDDDESGIPGLKPLNLYGDSKQKFDLWALEQERLGNSPIAWAGFKFFNVYGFGERHKGFMASVVLHSYDQMMDSGEVTLFKSHRAGIPDGHQKRDFIAVEDVVQVLHFALEKPIQRGIYNLGTGQARTFLDLVRAVYRGHPHLRKEEKIRFIETPLTIRDKYQYFTEAVMTKLRGQGYSKPFLSLEDGVSLYLERILRTKS